MKFKIIIKIREGDSCHHRMSGSLVATSLESASKDVAWLINDYIATREISPVTQIQTNLRLVQAKISSTDH